MQYSDACETQIIAFSIPEEMQHLGLHYWMAFYLLQNALQRLCKRVVILLFVCMVRVDVSAMAQLHSVMLLLNPEPASTQIYLNRSLYCHLHNRQSGVFHAPLYSKLWVADSESYQLVS